MSRIGLTPVSIPDGVIITVSDGYVTVKGAKGELQQSVPKGIQLTEEDGKIQVQRVGESNQVKANHGLIRSLVQNMVVGVSEGFSKKLELVGTGYRAKKQGQNLVLNVGYSQPVEFAVPEGVSIETEGDTIVVVSGIDNQQVGQVAADIRKIRKPEPYKGKGIRYKDEEIRKKAGKATKVGSG